MTLAQKKAIVKRTADMLEKLAAGSALVGLFQGILPGLFIGICCMAISYKLTLLGATL